MKKLIRTMKIMYINLTLDETSKNIRRGEY